MSTTTAPAIRRARPEDAEACGRICYDAFRTIAERHGFPPDFPAPEAAVGLLTYLLSHPGFHGVVAERGGAVVGSNFLDERSFIAGLGPITVDPAAQDTRVGRELMLALIDRAHDVGFPGVRLLQAGYHMRSLALYAKLGFDVREAVATIKGTPPRLELGAARVRPADEADVEACSRVCARVHGHDRSGELVESIEHGSARVVERNGEITGYTTGIAFFAHSVALTNDDLKALIATAGEFAGPGFLLPLRNAEVFRWCLDEGLRVVQVMTLMTRGFYQEPNGAYLPSILY